MHELAVTQSILEIVLKHTPPGARVSNISLVLGELSSYMDDSVQLYWQIIAAGTPAQAAQLHFRREAARMVCQVCGAQYSPRQALACPGCGSLRARLVAGEQFYVESIEVQREEDDERTHSH